MVAKPEIAVDSWRGVGSVVLRAGDLSATFLPGLGMLGVSFTHADHELLAHPRSLDEYRAGGMTGLPLLHPWANRLAPRQFTAAGRVVDLTDVDVPVDANGLPLHGSLHGQPFVLSQASTKPARHAATVVATIDFSTPELLATFPFRHRVSVGATLDPRGLEVRTMVTAGAASAVPISFGWHPYLRLPGTPRADWRLRHPTMRRHRLDSQLLPTGSTEKFAASDAPLGNRTYDDHFDLGGDRTFRLADPRRTITVRFGTAYPHAQLYLPPQSDHSQLEFICIEPMTAPTNALATGRAPTLAANQSFGAGFRIEVAANP